MVAIKYIKGEFMVSIQDTVYPYLKNNIDKQVLKEIYTPTKKEMSFVYNNTRKGIIRFCFVVRLKTFQKLGYFVNIEKTPKKIIQHIGKHLGIDSIPDLSSYDKSRIRINHMDKIRSYLKIKASGKKSNQIMIQTIINAAQSREDLADIINAAIEELIQQRQELPAFSTLLKAAYEGRASVNTAYYTKIYNILNDNIRKNIDSLFFVDEDDSFSLWQRIKEEPKNVTVTHLREWVKHYEWLSTYSVPSKILTALPEVKINQLASEARSLNSARMMELKDKKRYAIAAVFIAKQMGMVIDSFGEILIKQVAKMHRKSNLALTEFIEQNQERVDVLVDTFHHVLIARKECESSDQLDKTIKNIIAGREDQLIEDCEVHSAHAGKNYYPFLPRFYKNQRPSLFDVLNIVTLEPTTKDNSLVVAIEFIKAHRSDRKKHIEISEAEAVLADSSWISDRWWKFIFGVSRWKRATQMNRHHFELCVFYYIMLGLKSEDLFIPGSDQFADHRPQLVSWEEYDKEIEEYGKQVELPTDAEDFIDHIQNNLDTIAEKVDRSFPENETVTIINNEPVIKKYKRRPTPPGLRTLEETIAKRLEPVSILDVLTYTQKWVHWDSVFGPLSGFDGKLDDALLSYLATTFCYGCNLGPFQTARSIKDIDRFHLAWVNKRHISEEKLNDAIVRIINAYNLFELQKSWGTGETASVDGSKWDIYEKISCRNTIFVMVVTVELAITIFQIII